MANAVFDKAVTGLLTGLIDLDTAVIKAVPVQSYTVNQAHQFVSDVTGAGATLLAAGRQLQVSSGPPTITAGVLDADDITFTGSSGGGDLGSGGQIDGWLIYQASAVGDGADVASSAQRIIAWLDGKLSVTCAKAASTSDTSIAVERLDGPLANGSTVVFGGVTATLTVAAAADDRLLTVSALTGGIAAGVVGVSSAQGNMPIPTNGGDVLLSFSNAAGINIFGL